MPRDMDSRRLGGEIRGRTVGVRRGETDSHNVLIRGVGHRTEIGVEVRPEMIGVPLAVAAAGTIMVRHATDEWLAMDEDRQDIAGLSAPLTHQLTSCHLLQHFRCLLGEDRPLLDD